jgi:hypothetical protein
MFNFYVILFQAPFKAVGFADFAKGNFLRRLYDVNKLF